MMASTSSASINISPNTHVSGPVASPRIGSIGHGSFRDAVAASLGREVSHIMDYSLSKFGTSCGSDITVAPSTSYTHKLDSNFCRSFQCCGKELGDLHELLAHYEEEHTKDDFDDDFTECMDDAMSDDGSSRSSKSPSPRMINSTPALLKRKGFDTGEDLDPMDSPLTASKKRSYGSFSLNGPTGANVHQSLRRALIDGGVGSRRVPGSPSIYSANSPFSTPGSSMPGTPAIDQENDAYFSGALAANAFAGLSLRPNISEDHQMPSCAPPNLFFPAAGGSNSNMNGPPSKRERMNNGSALNASSGAASLSAAAAAAEAAHEALSKVAGGGGNGLGGVGTSNCGGMDSKPFKCLQPGCDKAYKQMNGLKYHKLHGHCNQNNLPPALQTQTGHLKNPGGPSAPSSPVTARKPSMPGSGGTGSSTGVNTTESSRQGTPTATGESAGGSPLTASAPDSPAAGIAANLASSSTATPSTTTAAGLPGVPGTPVNASAATAASSAGASGNATPEKMYLCQVGSCGKRYKNLNGLRYHYLHSGSHGLLGLQLLHANGGGASAKMDPTTGNATVSTLNLSEEAVAAAARAAAEQQAARVQKLHALQNAQKVAALTGGNLNKAIPAGPATGLGLVSGGGVGGGSSTSMSSAVSGTGSASSSGSAGSITMPMPMPMAGVLGGNSGTVEAR
ncbi:hypothetical protein CF326_g5049 [Tilletia indica]|nr:hypothetical protein CF326_g5049 [Tilletia indica]